MSFDVSSFPSWVQFIFYIAIFIVQFVSLLSYRSATKKKTDNQSNMLEVLDQMKYRLDSYRAEELSANSSAQSQIFDILEPQYKLNKKKNELEQVGTIDLVARAQQNADCALQAMLDKFGYDVVANAVNGKMPGCAPVVGTSEEAIADTYSDLLEDLMDLDEYKSDLVERYHLDPDISWSDLAQHLQKSSSELKSQLDSINSKKEVKNNEVSSEKKAE